jgi:hypothetical protein
MERYAVAHVEREGIRSPAREWSMSPRARQTVLAAFQPRPFVMFEAA